MIFDRAGHLEKHFEGKSKAATVIRAARAAKKCLIAQTVSSFGLHKDYHRPTDDLAHIDFTHLEGIASMIAPITWLANSDFKPTWNAADGHREAAPPDALTYMYVDIDCTTELLCRG